MSEQVYRIDYQGRELILIATAHVSHESAALVKEVIAAEKPDSVCIELDPGRFETVSNPKAWEQTDIIDVIKKKKVVLLMANLALGAYQKRIAEKLNIKVGQEMLEGIAGAKAVGAQLVLADRSIQTTFLRIWRGLGFGEKMKLFWSMFWASDDDAEITEADLQAMLEEDMLTSLMKEMRAEFPVVGQVLISERDQYLAAKIKEAPGQKVVAILGGAHVPGVREEIFKDQDVPALDIVPPVAPWTKALGWILPLAFVGLIGYGFFTSLSTGLAQLGAWVLWTGILSAIFTALSFAHPLSILTSLVVAPISTLNPLLAVGWFTGIVEASMKKPTVEDVQHVMRDIVTVKGFFTNRFLKIILVVTMANIGASIGTFVAGMELIKQLFL